MSMRCITVQPPPPLDASIVAIWFFEGMDFAHGFERILPDGAMQLLVNLHEDELRWREGSRLECPRSVGGAALAGAWSSTFAIDTAQQRRITGVSFAPGGASTLFAEPADVFTNRHVALDDLAGGRFLRERLLEAAQPPTVFRVWVEWLLGRYRASESAWIVPARARLERGDRVADVAARLGLGERRLRAQFRREVGLSPKVFARVARLQRLAREVAAGRHAGWAELAVQHGYADQAHMIHEFKSLTGMSPGAFSPRSANEWNHSVVS